MTQRVFVPPASIARKKLISQYDMSGLPAEVIFNVCLLLNAALLDWRASVVAAAIH
jgi:hypothetical protein